MYENLVSLINAYIKANGNNEITGPGLNNILASMVQTLGAGMTFCGVAVPTTKPVNNQRPKFYMAFTPGTYSMFQSSTALRFTSGFALLCDESGDNTWLLYNKAIEDARESFLVDANIKNNAFGTDTVFYIETAGKTGGTSTFELWSYNETTDTKARLAVFSDNNTLSGYKTHDIDTSSIKARVAVNWDTIAANETKTFAVEETKFPASAYVDLTEDESGTSDEARISALEAVCGFQVRNGTFAYTRIVPVHTYLQPDTPYAPNFNVADEAAYISSPYVAARKLNTLNTGAYSTRRTFTIEIKPSNFPGRNEYTIYLPNPSTIAHELVVQIFDTDDTTMRFRKIYDMEPGSITALRVLNIENAPGLYHKIDTFIYQ